MAIPFTRKFYPAARSVNIRFPKNSPLGDVSKNWMAWWYCGINNNFNVRDQPLVVVGFRELRDGYLSDNVELGRVLLTDLGQVTIGSVWRNGICNLTVEWDLFDFDVDFTPGNWRDVSFNDAVTKGIASPYPLDLHPLAFPKDKNWMLEFDLHSGAKLVVPALEYLSRCYGRSQELVRILATYGWEGAEGAQARIFSPIESPSDGNWYVKLRPSLRNGDTTFAAHIKYDPYTEQEARSINAKIQTGFDPQRPGPIFIKVAPWFVGPAKLRVRGCWFNKTSFLALQIGGCSDPLGESIFRDRDNRNKSEGLGPDDGSEAWRGARPVKLVRPPMIVSITPDASPDHGSARIEILDDDFVMLGIPRKIVDINGQRITSANGKKSDPGQAERFSSGDDYGTGKQVGHASVHAEEVFESDGILHEMWAAIKQAKLDYPSNITAVEWFTFSTGFRTDGCIQLISLAAPGDDADRKIPSKTRNWVYADLARTKTRGVLVMRMIVNSVVVHIIEIQRKMRKKKLDDDHARDEEDRLRGFALVLDDQTEFEEWLNEFISDVPYVRGIVQELIAYCPGRSYAFVHRSSESESMPCQAALLSALKNVGVRLPRLSLSK